MAKLIYSAITSLDGYIEDESGLFEWAMPSEEAHSFINDLLRPIGTYLYGRRLYETMIFWEKDPSFFEGSAVMADFAQIWKSAEKIVYSKTLSDISTARTQLEKNFAPNLIKQMKGKSESDLIIGGAELAREAFEVGLIDEYHAFLSPISIGNGKSALPVDVRLKLSLVNQLRFTDGMVYLHYKIRY